MKRKLFALALTATMVLGLAACGGSDSSSAAAPAAGGAESSAAGGAEMTSGGHRAAQSLSLFLQAQAATQTLQPVHLHSMRKSLQALTSSL